SNCLKALLHLSNIASLRTPKQRDNSLIYSIAHSLTQTFPPIPLNFSYFFFNSKNKLSYTDSDLKNVTASFIICFILSNLILLHLLKVFFYFHPKHSE